MCYVGYDRCVMWAMIGVVCGLWQVCYVGYDRCDMWAMTGVLCGL